MINVKLTSINDDNYKSLINYVMTESLISVDQKRSFVEAIDTFIAGGFIDINESVFSVLEAIKVKNLDEHDILSDIFCNINKNLGESGACCGMVAANFLGLKQSPQGQPTTEVVIGTEAELQNNAAIVLDPIDGFMTELQTYIDEDLGISWSKRDDGCLCGVNGGTKSDVYLLDGNKIYLANLAVDSTKDAINYLLKLVRDLIYISAKNPNYDDVIYSKEMGQVYMEKLKEMFGNKVEFYNPSEVQA